MGRVPLAIVLGLVAGSALASPHRDADAGGTVDIRPVGPCLTEPQRVDLEREVDATIARLTEEGALSTSRGDGTLLFSWPLRPSPSYEWSGYHAVASFVDLDPAFPDQLLDFECGERTYDTTSGYNHPGVDYVLWPFWWYMMDNEFVEIIAAAPGTIVSKQDGNYDRSCTPGGTWNAVVVLHDDGSRAYYGHMKTGSLTTKPVGAAVARDEYLGLVASSGNSGLPHLHFEVKDADWNAVELHSGACQPDPTRWDHPRVYHDSAINALLTHYANPAFPVCPIQEIPHLSDSFLPGDDIIFGAYYRDQLSSQVTEYEVREPDGTVAWAWSHSATQPHTAVSQWRWQEVLPADAPSGAWTFSASYEETLYEHTFVVQELVGADHQGPPAKPMGLRQLSSNPFSARAEFEITLTETSPVRMSVFNVSGQRVATLVNDTLEGGSHVVVWDGRDGTGDRAPSGVYFARLRTNGGVATTRIVLAE